MFLEKISFMAAKHGYAVHLEWDSITKEILTAALNKAMFDKEMKRKVEKTTKIFRDQKDDPVEKAVWWIEYVMRHGGTDFLRPHSLDLYWFQYICLDIVVFLGAILIFAFVGIFKCWKMFACKKVEEETVKDDKVEHSKLYFTNFDEQQEEGNEGEGMRNNNVLIKRMNGKMFTNGVGGRLSDITQNNFESR